jgi:hypothetical protein
MKKQGLAVSDKGQIPYYGVIDPKTGLPQGIDKGWDYQPGANQTTPLYDLIARKLPGLPAPLGAAMMANLKDALVMEQQLAWWDTLDEWLKSGKQASRLAVVGAIDPDTLAWLDSVKSIQPITAEIAVPDSLILGQKQRRHTGAGNALTDAEWLKLPEMLANPERILFDTRSGKLLYIYPAEGTDKASLLLSLIISGHANSKSRTLSFPRLRRSRQILTAWLKEGFGSQSSERAGGRQFLHSSANVRPGLWKPFPQLARSLTYMIRYHTHRKIQDAIHHHQHRNAV